MRGLLADGLVDELHLFVFPLALASGQRLLEEGDERAKFSLAEFEAYESGVVHLAYKAA